MENNTDRENVALEDENVTEVMDQALDDAAADQVPEIEDAQQTTQTAEETKVPLSTLTKMRKRAQEAESKAKWLEEQFRAQVNTSPAKAEEEDTSAYETVTKAELSQSHRHTERLIHETVWIQSNQEKADFVNEMLPDFLNQRPNLRSAIEQAPNRYEEAYTLMTALTPKQQAAIKTTPPKKESKQAPGAPGSIQKAAALSEAVDVMKMSDSEFSTWRKEQKRRR